MTRIFKIAKELDTKDQIDEVNRPSYRLEISTVLTTQ